MIKTPLINVMFCIVNLPRAHPRARIFEPILSCPSLLTRC